MKVKSLFVSMFAIAALASCSQDDQPNLGGEGNVVAGQKTYATFTFNVDGGTKTRANMTPEGGNDADIADLRLLIFDGEGTSAKLLINDVVGAGDKTKTVETTSGVKRIFVLANSGAGTSTTIGTRLDNMTAATTLANFYDLMSNPIASQDPVVDMGPEFAEMITNNKILMSNVADVSSKQTLVANVSATESENAPAGTAGKNHFSIKVKRAIAKGNLAVAKTQTEDGFTFAGDITYGVRNVNRSVNYVQQFENHNVSENDLDPTHTATAIRPWAPYYNVFDGMPAADLANLDTYKPYYYGLFAIATSGNDVAQVAPVLPATRTKSVYFTENSNNLQVKGNSTYFGIAASLGAIGKAKIAKKFDVNLISGRVTTEAADNDYTAGDNLYMIRKFPTGVKFTTGHERSIFTDETLAWQSIYNVLIQGGLIKTVDYADADALKTAATNDKMVTAAAGGKFNLHEYFGVYTAGKCYYRLDIHEKIGADKRHLVRRNHNYVATVNTFATIGEPTEGDLDNNPETPVDALKTYVTATITVAPWHDVNMDGDL